MPERTAQVTELRVNQRRPSLVAELRDGSRARLILVSAPAGAGKTTVLASWRADPAEQRPFAWLSLDSRDNDPVRFWNHVLAALRTVAPDAGAGVDDALRSSGGDVTDLALPLLVNALTSLPGKVAESDPRLCLARAWMLLVLGRPGAVEAEVRAAERGVLPGPLADGSSSVESSGPMVRTSARPILGDVSAALDGVTVASRTL